MQLLCAVAFLLLCSIGATAQNKPKEHVYYDTIKTVKTRIDFASDTIPVYFKEIIVSADEISEHWQTGYLIWQTYKKSPGALYLSTSGSFTNSMTLSAEPNYYVDEYQFTKGAPGSFLYSDKKPVKNKVFYCIKR